ncbi:hypothetical protein Tco_0934533 [Tanacetum coccineum]
MLSLKSFLPKRARRSGKFLIPCEFPGMEICLRLGRSCVRAKHLMAPLSNLKKLSLPELSPTNDFRWQSHFDVRAEITIRIYLEESILTYDKSISLESDHDDCDPEEDIYVLEQLLNDDPFQLPLMDLKQSEVTEAKSSIEEPPELELKDLPSHLEYAFLEENICCPPPRLS